LETSNPIGWQIDLLTYYLILNSERNDECIDLTMMKKPKNNIGKNEHFYAKPVR